MPLTYFLKIKNIEHKEHFDKLNLDIFLAIIINNYKSVKFTNCKKKRSLVVLS